MPASLRRIISEVGATIAIAGVVYNYFNFPYSDYVGIGAVILGLSLIYIGLNIIKSPETKQGEVKAHDGMQVKRKNKATNGSGGGCPFSGNNGSDGVLCPFSSSGEGNVTVGAKKAAVA
jgi:hypothetical protein